MSPPNLVCTLSEFVLIQGHDKTAQPVFVHKHLLNGRALRYGKIFHTALDDETTYSRWESMDILTIRVDLKSLRAIEMWSLWLYGLPMWSEDDCYDVDDDMKCLADIIYLCAGYCDGRGRDYDGLNACVDAIRHLVLNEAHVPMCPISVLDLLVNESYESGLMIKMLAELLVHGECVRNGRTKSWLEQIAVQHPSFLEAVSNKFAKKAMGEVLPDPTARCAYHTHLPGSECDPGPRGRAWKASVDVENTYPLRDAAVLPTRSLRPDHAS